MSDYLPDGTVIPSYLGLRSQGRAQASGQLDNIALRYGEIKDIIYPDDKRSVGKKFVEYEVEIQFKNGSATGSTMRQTGVMLMNPAGGVADQLRYTLRKDKEQKQQAKGDDGVGVGSKVLLLSVNGDVAKTFIVGGFRDPKHEKVLDKKEDGHNFYFEFNGISFAVDKDGQAKLQFKGATKVDGKLDTDAGADEKNGPTTIEIKKNGNLKISTKDDKQYVHIDHENKKVEFLFDEEWNVKVNKKVVWDVGDSIEFTGNSTLKIAIAKDVSFATSGGKIDIGASDRVYVKSAGVHVGSATDAWMLGTTYRSAESQLMTQLMTALTALGGQLTAAGSSLTAASVLNAIPIVGGGMAAAGFAAAGATLISAMATLTQAVTAITTFEGQAATYLSTKNKTD